ncbi:hypothetical protein SLEP1_g33470 [Rubroshorea leprosula]|uniref:Uncharacterized protein n=1 Tax=Rubroshorea leprosula TaxID=152421 RepID=A0AAV5KGX0_9ROSI|nr:hypothetical protein SLEP1_g33470 [Rubroshorea leprosula]
MIFRPPSRYVHRQLLVIACTSSLHPSSSSEPSVLAGSANSFDTEVLAAKDNLQLSQFKDGNSSRSSRRSPPQEWGREEYSSPWGGDGNHFPPAKFRKDFFPPLSFAVVAVKSISSVAAAEAIYSVVARSICSATVPNPSFLLLLKPSTLLLLDVSTLLQPDPSVLLLLSPSEPSAATAAATTEQLKPCTLLLLDPSVAVATTGPICYCCCCR